MSVITDLFGSTDTGSAKTAGNLQNAAAIQAAQNTQNANQTTLAQLAPWAGYGREALSKMGDLMGMETPPEMKYAQSAAAQAPQKYFQSQNIGGFDTPNDVDPAIFQQIFNDYNAQHMAKYHRGLTKGEMGDKYASDWNNAMQQILSAARAQTSQKQQSGGY
jgi:hypothetical protein